MKDALSKALAPASEDPRVDRILAVSFFRSRGAAGSMAEVIELADRRATRATTARS